MSDETRKSSEQDLGCLGGCLVEGDAEQRTRERRIRRRSLILSIALQSAVVAAIVLFPLFGRTERLALANTIFIPMPPSSPHGGNHPQPQPRPHTGRFHTCVICPSLAILHRAPMDDPTPPTLGDGAGPASPIDDGPGAGDVVGGSSDRHGPEKPHEEQPHKTVRVSGPIDPAMLIHRVEPLYPAIPRQTGRSGRVELRAIIATDGTIQSLQVVSGDPLFYRSALDAVSQWRYRPTYLNGQPVEVDTFITVVYTMQR